MNFTGNLDRDVEEWAMKNVFANDSCPSSQLPMASGTWYFVYVYVFPLQFILGVVGNALNLCVLLSRNMRSEANILLAAMAIADIVLFFTILPSALGVWSPFYLSDMFRIIIYKTTTVVLYLSNVFSCVTSWLMLAVSVERYMGIRSPMHTRFHWGDWRVRYIIASVIAGSFLLTFYHVFEYELGYTKMCNGTLTWAKIVSIEKNRFSSKWKVCIVRVMKVAQIFLVVVLPFIGVAFLNLQIIIVLRRSGVIVTRSIKNVSNEDSAEEFMRRYSDMDSRQKRDRKVTVTVLAIIACFFLTHTPSTIPFIVELSSSMLTKEQSVTISRWMPHLQPAIHAWLLTGKVANFVLFCMSSVYFRRRLNIIIRTRCHCDSQQKKYSGVSSGLSVRGQPMKMSTLKYRDAVARQSSCTTHVE